MVAYYTILGQKIGAHFLAIGTLSTIFGATYVFTGGKKAPAPGQAPPINASSSDEESFIKKFLEDSSAEEKKEKH